MRPLIGVRLEIKRIDKAFDPETGEWVISDGREQESEKKKGSEGQYSGYEEYAFVVRRKLLSGSSGTTKIIFFSNVLLTAARDVLKDVRQLSWNSEPFKVC